MEDKNTRCEQNFEGNKQGNMKKFTIFVNLHKEQEIMVLFYHVNN